MLICLDFLDFFDTPAPWWIVAMEGRTGFGRGGFAFLRDLSRLRDGENSLLAARERREGAVRRSVLFIFLLCVSKIKRD